MGVKSNTPPGEVRAVLLDALGTLLELEPPAPLLAKALRAEHGVEIEPADARRAVAAEISHYRRHNHLAGTPAALAGLRRECAEVVHEQLGGAVAALMLEELERTLLGSLRFTPYPEVAGALGGWRAAGIRLAIVSNWDISLHDVLAASPLRGAFDAVVVSAQEGLVKPDPRLWQIALERLDVPAAGAVHVGDSYEHDVLGARAAGVEPVLIARAGAPDAEAASRLARAGGVRVIAGLDELGPALS